MTSVIIRNGRSNQNHLLSIACNSLCVQERRDTFYFNINWKFLDVVTVGLTRMLQFHGIGKIIHS